jgi:hypothetical protein
MIHYALVCDQHHEFESWFANSAAYDNQVKRGLVTCPSCGSAKVEKAVMTPRLARSHTRPRQEGPEEAHQSLRKKEMPPQQLAEAAPEAMPRPAPVAMMTPQEQEFRQKLRELRDHLVKNAENVGSRFPEEARKMHYGESERRSIYGVASAQDAQALDEEGIAFSALPVLPDERN